MWPIRTLATTTTETIMMLVTGEQTAAAAQQSQGLFMFTLAVLLILSILTLKPVISTNSLLKMIQIIAVKWKNTVLLRYLDSLMHLLMLFFSPPLWLDDCFPIRLHCLIEQHGSFS